MRETKNPMKLETIITRLFCSHYGLPQLTNPKTPQYFSSFLMYVLGATASCERQLGGLFFCWKQSSQLFWETLRNGVNGLCEFVVKLGDSAASVVGIEFEMNFVPDV